MRRDKETFGFDKGQAWSCTEPNCTYWGATCQELEVRQSFCRVRIAVSGWARRMQRAGTRAEGEIQHTSWHAHSLIDCSCCLVCVLLCCECITIVCSMYCVYYCVIFLKVRLSSTPCLNCADLMHVGSGTYQVLSPGNLNCLTSGGEYRLLTLNTSSTVFQLSPYLGCYNTHLSFGDCKLKVCMCVICLLTLADTSRWARSFERKTHTPSMFMML